MTASTRSKLRAVLSVFGIVLTVVAGYNTWAQIDAMNAADGGVSGSGAAHSGQTQSSVTPSGQTQSSVTPSSEQNGNQHVA